MGARATHCRCNPFRPNEAASEEVIPYTVFSDGQLPSMLQVGQHELFVDQLSPVSSPSITQYEQQEPHENQEFQRLSTSSCSPLDGEQEYDEHKYPEHAQGAQENPGGIDEDPGTVDKYEEDEEDEEEEEDEEVLSSRLNATSPCERLFTLG